MKKEYKKRWNTKTLALITWFLCLLALIYANMKLPAFDIFPDSLKVPFLIVSVIIILILLVLSLRNRTYLFNLILAAALIIANLAAAKIQNNQDTLFVEPATTSVTSINCYVMDSEYRNDHSSSFEDLDPSTSLSDYSSKTFIVQDQFDQTNQSGMIDVIEEQLGTSINLLHKDTVKEALEALYAGEGDVLILNKSFLSAAKSISQFKNIDSDTFILYTLTVGEEETQETNASTIEPFTLYIAGNDTREDTLTVVGRTDVDMIMAVNPENKQILVVSIPRDFYIENPALDNGLDKLTHLGNHGIQNTLDGVNAYFGLNLTNYLCTNFSHFEDLVDSIGGLTIYNEYAFTAFNRTDFAEGTITLNGAEALDYARERKSLTNGDYDRNAHQVVILQAILEKIQDLSASGEKSTVITALANDFLTNLDIDDLYNMYSASKNASDPWEFITYHLGGEGTYAGTISMGMDRELYVCKPFASQVTFATEQINKVLNGETIQQEELPDQDNTTFVEN